MGIRAQFEDFGSSPDFGLSLNHFIKDEDGRYLNYPTECYWLMWQASRAAMLSLQHEARDD